MSQACNPLLISSACYHLAGDLVRRRACTTLCAAPLDSRQGHHLLADLRRLDSWYLIHISLWPCAGTGVVKENGAGTSRFHVDQRVVAAPWPSNEGNGTWQQYVVVEEEVRPV